MGLAVCFWRELPTPTRCPVLLVAAAHDDLVPLAHVQDAFARIALERKQLAVHDCGHFEVYTDPRFEENAAAQARFLSAPLAGGDAGTVERAAGERSS